MAPAVDRAVGPAFPAVRVAVGTREYDAIRESVAAEAVDYTTYLHGAVLGFGGGLLHLAIFG